MRPRVYITQPVAMSAIERLQQAAEVDWNRDPLHIATKQELVDAARTHDVLFCLLHDRIDREIINANPRLKMIASTTITPADIDIAAATERRIPVTTVPSPLLDDSTADLAWALLLSVARRVAEGDRLIRSGVIPGSQSCYLEGGGVSRRTLGIVGMGGVGRAAARRAAGFAMKVIYHDPKRLSEDEERALGVTWVPFDDVLQQADFVSLHVALTPKTRHLIGAREFALMKSTAYFINTARGPIVDEEALIEALQRKRIAGAGLDVYEHEPDIDARLVALPNVVMTPHTGSADRELRAAMANVAVDNILAVLAGREPPNCWNREIYANG
ncbi:MAG: 2-hydroxyacid dehydrogenase [Rhodospirillaceae bacterium]